MFSELIGHVKSAANSVGSFVKANPLATAAMAGGAVLAAGAAYVGMGGNLTQLATQGAGVLNKITGSMPSVHASLNKMTRIVGPGMIELGKQVSRVPLG